MRAQVVWQEPTTGRLPGYELQRFSGSSCSNLNHGSKTMMLRPRPRVRYVVPLLIVATLIMWTAPAESGPAAQDDQPQPVETEFPEKPTLK